MSGRNGGLLREAGMQVDAAVRGAADVFTAGYADEIAAGVNTTLSGGGPTEYRRNLRAEQARDRYDAAHRNVARTTGKAAAVLLPMAGAGLEAATWSAGLRPYRKGQLGEQLSMLKTQKSGDRVVGEQVRTDLSRGYTRADHATGRGMLVEAKFGPSARLSDAQKRAVREIADRYRVDWWGPRDAGGLAATGVGSGMTGMAVSSDRRDRR